MLCDNGFLFIGARKGIWFRRGFSLGVVGSVTYLVIYA
jgi:hypothetical protein